MTHIHNVVMTCAHGGKAGVCPEAVCVFDQPGLNRQL